MPKFDAELYLRMRGEELLLSSDNQNRGWGSPLGEPAGALVAVGAISAARARTVLDDYELADALRSEHGLHQRVHFGRMASPRRRRPKALSPRRVCPCDATLETTNGTLLVHRVSLAADGVSIAITWTPTGPARRGPRAPIFGGPSQPPNPTITDDRGTQMQAGFSGGGGDVWHGHLTTGPGLSPDTAWIEVDGERLELSGEPWPSVVTIERLAKQPPALRYLWRQLETRDHWHGEAQLDATIDALLAAGVVGAGDPELADVRAVYEVMPHHPGMPSRGPSTALPEPWKSAFARRGRTDGRDVNLALAAVTPLFDGCSVAVSAFDAQPEQFVIEVDVTPGLDAGGPRRRGAFDDPRLGWWAADDRGNHYLGGVGSWSNSGDRSTGQIHFSAPVHPKAKTLRIMPTADTSRAVIAIRLPT